MRYIHSLLKIYFKTILFLIPTFLCGQNEAIIVGKISNPQARTLTFRYRNNPLFYDESTLRTSLDTGNNFFVRVKAKTSQTIYMDYQEKKYKFFLTPGDTLKINLDDRQPIEKTVLEGSAAANNTYLLKFNSAFPDWVDENVMTNQRRKLNAVDYQIYIDSLYKAKRWFFDNYPITEINNFTSEFFDFTSQDIQYWRAYMLMKYYDEYHTSTEPSKSIDENYLNFLIEVQTSSVSALNNDNCLKFLSLYLDFLKDKYLPTNLAESNAISEQRIITQTVRPIIGNVRVLVDPFTSKEIIGWMSSYNRAEFLNLKTDDKFRYIGSDTTFEDTFLKIKTEEGKIGWVPASSVRIIDQVTIKKNIIERHCFDKESPLCGLEKYLNDRVLYLTAGKEVLVSYLNDEKADAEIRLAAYSKSNVQYPEYTDFLTSALVQTFDKKKNGILELGFTPICTVTDPLTEKLSAIASENNNDTRVKKPVIISGPSTTNPNYSIINSNTNITIKNENKEPEAITKPTKQSATINQDSLIKISLGIPVSIAPSITKTNEVNNSIVGGKINESVNTNSTSNTASVSTPAIKNTAPLLKQEIKPVIVPPVATGTKNNSDKVVVSPPIKTNTTEDAPNTNKISAPQQPQVPSVVNTTVATTSELKKTKPTVIKENPIVAAPENKSSASSNEQSYDFTEQNKKYFANDEIIKSVDLNLAQELVRSNPNEKNEPIKKFEGLVLGSPVTPFTFVDLNGKEVSQQELLGKIIFIEFWASWCGPCQAQMSHAQELAKSEKYRDDVVFLFISKDEDPSKWKESLETNHWKAGAHGNDAVIIPLNFGVQFLPNTFIVDKKGKISFNSMINKNTNLTDEKIIETLVRAQK